MDYKEFLESIEYRGFLYHYIVSLVSSDELITMEDCEISLNEIDLCLNALPEVEFIFADKEKIKIMLLQGRAIVLKEIERIKTDESNN